MSSEVSRRELMKASMALGAAALLPLSTTKPTPALDLEELFAGYPMSKVLLGIRSGSYLSSGGALIAKFLTEDGRFNITAPLRLAFAQILADGKDIIFDVGESHEEALLRDAMVIHLFRRFGVPGFMRYGEVDFEPGPSFRPVIGLCGNLATAPHIRAMLLTRESHRWQNVRQNPQACPIFQSCVIV